MELSTMTYAVEDRVARITLDRPERGNGITMDMPRELAACVERADIDPLRVDYRSSIDPLLYPEEYKTC